MAKRSAKAAAESYTRDELSISKIDGRSTLIVTETGLPLVQVDFLSARATHRRLQGQEGKRSLLGKALGLHRHPPGLVVDCTAGLGVDAFAMARLGCRVVMVEREPLLQELLQDGLDRAKEYAAADQDVELTDIFERMTLIASTAEEVLQELSNADSEMNRQYGTPPVVYLDPMFPHRDKSALVKKELRALAALACPPTESEASELLKLAVKVASRSVVVKRMKRNPFFAGVEPHHQVQGKAVRYDVYHSSRPGD